MDPDEPVYGQVAKQMATGSGWLTPHFGGKMWFDKPPLFYWFSGASASVFGSTELSYRLPSAILAVALVFLVFALVRYDFGKKAGIFSAVIMATCMQQIVLARAAVTDMTFVFFLTAAIYGYRRWYDAVGRSRFGWAVVCGAMTGLAMLAKGPVAPLLIGGAVFIHLVWSNKAKRLISLDALTAVATMLFMGLPWYLAMYVLHKDAFVQGFLVANNINRFLKPEHAEVTGSWKSYFINIPILLAFFLPWSVFLPQAIARGWRSNDGAKLAIVWFAEVFVFFSISKTILPTYIFPIYPAAALFVGCLWNSAIDKDSRTRRGLVKALWVQLGLSALIMAALLRYAHKKFPETEPAAIVLGGILVVTGLIALWLIRSSKKSAPERSFWAIALGMVAFAIWIVVGALPFVGPRNSTRDLAAQLEAIPSARIAEFGLTDDTYILRPQSMVYYFGNKIEHVSNDTEVRGALSSEKPVFIIGKQTDMEKFVVNGSVACETVGKIMVVANPAAAALKGKQAR